MHELVTAIVFLPLLGAAIAGILGSRIGPWPSMVVSTGSLLGSMICAWIAFFKVCYGDGAGVYFLAHWVDSDTLNASWSLRYDQLTAVMGCVVTTVSAMVHVYSIGYMSHDPHRQRFFAYISLFTFFMLMLVTSDNLFQLYLGWEGVGLASYLLIGFWYEKPSANAAAIKAFIVNRVGDFGFALGIMGAFMLFGTIELADIFREAPNAAGERIEFLGAEFNALEVICLLLFVGAMGKSAQLGLHTWLADAMEGPTPVSALIHAATMVTAGVFMLARMSPVFEYAPFALEVVTIVGALTCFIAATIGITQFDIKRVIAYSTMSQLGYMFFACGVSAYQAGIFHLSTHACFKALLFLGAGSVIHSMSDEQDMRKMGGLARMIPATYVLMWIGSLALAGIWPLAGYYSKDLIIEAAWGAHSGVGLFGYWMGTIAAGLTALYTFRVIFMTFHQEKRQSPEVLSHVHESPLVMILPMSVLAVGAIFLGMVGFNDFVGENMKAFWGDSIFVLPSHDPIEAAHHIPFGLKILPLVLGLSGIALAFVSYQLIRPLPGQMAKALKPLHALLYNKWYFDELYDWMFTRPAHVLGRIFWITGDKQIIDGLGPDGTSLWARVMAGRLAALQTGFLYHYAFVMLIGVAIFVTWYLVGG